MDLDRLDLFAEVARTGSFAEVARRRELDPSAVSRAISQLETELGTRLLQRTTRSLALTEAGQRFAKRAEVLLEDFEAARAEALEATDIPKGTVRITASVGFAQVCIVPLLGALLARHPGLAIDLVATDANLDLVTDGIDLAIRLAPRPAGDYVAAKLRSTSYRVVASPDFAKMHPMTEPSDLKSKPCLCFPLPGFRTRWTFRDREGAISEVPVTGPVQATTSLALSELARQGLGATLLGDWLVDEHIASGELIDLFPTHEVTATQYDTAAWLLYPSRRYLPAKTRAVVAFLREKLGN
ncbi:LysR substrate-binding domain-containing protein [Devosia sp.]|uniref:LysR family transcriptional regulator n=1 Tax=Devosia sp. TaxID=1871048 RepID=UPI003BAAD259